MEHDLENGSWLEGWLEAYSQQANITPLYVHANFRPPPDGSFKIYKKNHIEINWYTGII